MRSLPDIYHHLFQGKIGSCLPTNFCECIKILKGPSRLVKVVIGIRGGCVQMNTFDATHDYESALRFENCLVLERSSF